MAQVVLDGIREGKTVQDGVRWCKMMGDSEGQQGAALGN